LKEKKAKEEELRKIKEEQEERRRRKEDLEKRRIEADRKRARLLEEAERKENILAEERKKKEELKRKFEEEQKRKEARERKRQERLEQKRLEEERRRKAAEEEERSRVIEEEEERRRLLAKEEVRRIQAEREGEERQFQEERAEEQRAVVAAARAVEEKRRQGSEKSSPAVWAAVKALSEFVDSSETRSGGVPRSILMAIMQLTQFLSKDSGIANTGGRELDSAQRVSSFMEKPPQAAVPGTLTAFPATPSVLTTPPHTTPGPRRVTPGPTQGPRTPSPIRSRVLPASQGRVDEQDLPLLRQFSRDPTPPSESRRPLPTSRPTEGLSLFEQIKNRIRQPEPTLQSESRPPPSSVQRRPFPDSANIFLPSPTPAAPPSPTSASRFPARTPAVRSNGQFSFGELPVRRRRNQGQGRI